jgi:anti-sigma regulatory factor (Ser/Thr protein kinase)
MLPPGRRRGWYDQGMGYDCERGIRIPGGPRASSDARAALTDELASRVDDDRLRDLHLVVSEIVNNSVLHGRVGEDGWIEIDCSVGDGHLRVEVRDTGVQGTPAQREPDYGDGGGFGLFIVDALCARWGVEHDPRLRVWFELGLDAQT